MSFSVLRALFYLITIIISTCLELLRVWYYLIRTKVVWPILFVSVLSFIIAYSPESEQDKIEEDIQHDFLATDIENREPYPNEINYSIESEEGLKQEDLNIKSEILMSSDSEDDESDESHDEEIKASSIHKPPRKRPEILPSDLLTNSSGSNQA